MVGISGTEPNAYAGFGVGGYGGEMLDLLDGVVDEVEIA